MFPKPF